MSMNRALGTTTAGFASGDLVPQLQSLHGTMIPYVEVFCHDAPDAQWRRTTCSRNAEFAQRLVSAAQQHSLTFWSCHAPFGGVDLSALDDDLRLASIEATIEVVRLAADIGAGTVVVHAGTEPSEDEPREPLMQQALRSLDAVCDEASSRGVRLALETLPRTCLGNRVAEIMWMLEQVDGELGVCYDINHVGLYEDVPETVRALGSRIITTHISDHDGQERHWLPGQGITDWRAFIAALDEIGYEGPLMHEAFLANEELQATFAAIEGFWATLQG